MFEVGMQVFCAIILPQIVALCQQFRKIRRNKRPTLLPRLQIYAADAWICATDLAARLYIYYDF